MENKKKPLTREEALRDKSSMNAPMVFTVTHEDGTKVKIFASSKEVKVKEIKDEQ